MAKRSGAIKAWVQTLDAAIAEGAEIRMICTACKQYRDVDLVALRAKVGGSYSLINRRCRCRITPGCEGWNQPWYREGVYRHLWDEETNERWMWIDWKRQRHVKNK